MSMRWMNAALVLAAALMLVWADPAHAADQGREVMVLTQGPLLQALVVLGLLAAASILSFFSPGVVGRRFGFVTGAHYVVLGALVAATGAGFSAESLRVMEPMMALIVGAVALGAGLQLAPRYLSAMEGPDIKLAVVVSVVSALVMLGLPLGLLVIWGGAPNLGAWTMGIAALGVVALTADDDHLRRLTEILGVSSPAAARAGVVTRLCAVAALIGLLAVFALNQPTSLGLGAQFKPLVGLGLHLALGALGGGVAGALLQGRPDDDRMITIVLGVGVTLSAVAYAAGLSVVVVNVVAGVIMASMSSESLRLTKLMEGWGAPLYVLTLFFAGTLWTGASSALVWGAVVGFVLLRYLGRLLGVLAYRPKLRGFRPEPGTHRALWAPGALGAAVVIDLSDPLATLPQADLTISALVLALALADLLSYVFLRGWLIDISEVDAERRAHSPWGGWQEAR